MTKDHSVLIDWNCVGFAAWGEELGQLVAGTLLFPGDIGIEQASDFERTCFAQYIVGMGQFVAVDSSAIRHAYVVSTVIRWTWDFVARTLHPTRRGAEPVRRSRQGAVFLSTRIEEALSTISRHG